MVSFLIRGRALPVDGCLENSVPPSVQPIQRVVTESHTHSPTHSPTPSLSLSILCCQVDESMRVCPSGGTMAAVERVEALALPLSAVDAFMADDSLAKTPGCCFGLMWGCHWLQQQQQQQHQATSLL